MFLFQSERKWIPFGIIYVMLWSKTSVISSIKCEQYKTAVCHELEAQKQGLQ